MNDSNSSGIENLVNLEKERGGAKGNTALMLPSPSAPVAVARRFVKDRCLHAGVAGALTVRYWCGSWWTWCTTHWVEAQPHAMKSLLYAFTADAMFIDAEGEFKPWSPTRNKIADLLEALSSLVSLSDEFEQPCWIDGRETGPIVATSNGLLDVASLKLHPHTPLYFGQVSVPFDYDPDAPEATKWIDFLGELWPDEPDAVDVLGEWFGYVISGRLDLQKIFIMIGPTRGGKGVVARILTALVGKRNVCGPTLSSFGSQFGLQPLLGKSLAIISDARSGGGKNAVPSVTTERLLSISGEDTLTVDRKFKEPYTGKLSDRLHIISNELPRFGDASGAIIGRLVLLTTTRSWLGRENHKLEGELRPELSCILNWSLKGLRRLTIDNENHFTRFAAADDAVIQMHDLASPVRAFVRERCVVEADAEIATDDLWAAYKDWSQASEYPKKDKAHFGRDLKAAFPSVRKRRPRDGSRRHWVYGGIRLRTEADEEDGGDGEGASPVGPNFSGHRDHYDHKPETRGSEPPVTVVTVTTEINPHEQPPSGTAVTAGTANSFSSREGKPGLGTVVTVVTAGTANSFSSQKDGSREGRAEPAPYDYLAPAPPDECCMRCGKAGRVSRIKHNGVTSLFHYDCFLHHLDAMANPPVTLPDLGDDPFDDHGEPKEPE